MKKKMILLPIGLASAILLGACTSPADAPQTDAKQNQAVQNQTTEQVSEEGQEADTESKMVAVKESDLNELKEDNESKADYINSLEKELKYYKEYVQSMTNTMTEDKLAVLIEKEWTYTLAVNGINFPSNGVLDMEATDFELILKEEKAPYSVLSEENQAKGQLKNDITKSISSSVGEMTLKEEDLKKEVVISYTGLEKGTTINIAIEEELQKKMGLTTNQLVINLK